MWFGRLHFTRVLSLVSFFLYKKGAGFYSPTPKIIEPIKSTNKRFMETVGVEPFSKKVL